jgi:hypothetical protein
MQALEPIIIVGGAVIVAAITAAITTAYWARRHQGLYNRGWNAGREFAARQLHDHLTR